MLTPAGAMAVALVTAQHHSEKAEAFWRGIADPDGLRSADPRKVYREHLRGQPKKGTELVTAKGGAIAWNAFYESRSIPNPPTQTGPVVILGTPFARLA